MLFSGLFILDTWCSISFKSWHDVWQELILSTNGNVQQSWLAAGAAPAHTEKWHSKQDAASGERGDEIGSDGPETILSGELRFCWIIKMSLIKSLSTVGSLKESVCERKRENKTKEKRNVCVIAVLYKTGLSFFRFVTHVLSSSSTCLRSRLLLRLKDPPVSHPFPAFPTSLQLSSSHTTGLLSDNGDGDDEVTCWEKASQNQSVSLLKKAPRAYRRCNHSHATIRHEHENTHGDR